MEKFTLKVRKIGNSKGIVIPQKILKLIETDQEEILIEVDESGILLKSNKETVRNGWEKSFKKMAKHKDDQLIIPDVFENEKFDAWK
jgi:antitoxin MazE